MNRPSSPPTESLDLPGGQRCWVDAAAMNAFGVDTDSAMIDLMQRSLAEPSDAQMLKDDVRSRVWRFNYGQREAVAKQFRRGGVKTRIGHWLRCSPAWREWRGAIRLSDAGARAVLPLGLIHTSMPCTQTLILPLVNGQPLSHVLRDFPADHGARRRLAIAIGKQIAHLTAQGLVNRDHKSANLMIDLNDEDWTPWMIDPAGLRARRSDEQVFAMLALLAQTTCDRGNVRRTDCLACLKAVLEADPSIAGEQQDRLKYAARSVLDAAAARRARRPL